MALQMTQHFDVAVIGTQNTGLLAAALLAKRDHRVTILDHGENTRSYRHHGVHLPLTPNLTPSFDGSTAFRKVHQELGIIPKLRSTISPRVPCFQVVMPPHRIDVRGNREEFIHEVRREFPELTDTVQRFCDRLLEADQIIGGFLDQVGPFPPMGFRDHWRQHRSRHLIREFSAPFQANQILEGIPTEHPLRRILLGLLVFFGNLATPTPSFLHGVRLIARYFQGTLDFLDPLRGGLNHLLHDAAQDAGASLHRDALVRELEIDGRRVSRIVFSDDRRPITADHVVYSAQAPLSTLLRAGKARSVTAREEQQTRPPGALVVCNMIVRREVIPCGMGEALVLLDARPVDRKHEPFRQPLFVQRYPVAESDTKSAWGHETKLDPDRVTLSVALPMRSHEVGQSAGQLGELRVQLKARLQHVIPYLDHYTTDISFPLETEVRGSDGDEPAQAIDPRSIYPLYESLQHPWLGVASRKSRGFLKNLIRSGSDVLPGLGLEGEYLTALQVADTITKITQKKSP